MFQSFMYSKAPVSKSGAKVVLFLHMCKKNDEKVLTILRLSIAYFFFLLCKAAKS